MGFWKSMMADLGFGERIEAGHYLEKDCLSGNPFEHEHTIIKIIDLRKGWAKYVYLHNGEPGKNEFVERVRLIRSIYHIIPDPHDKNTTPPPPDPYLHFKR